MTAFFSGIFAAFVFGTMWFWLGFLVLTAIMLYELENDKNAAATVVFILTLLFFWGTKMPLVSFVFTHPVWTIGGYLAGGVIWSFIKWSWFCAKFRNRYTEAKAEFAARYKLAPNFDPSNDLRVEDKTRTSGYSDVSSDWRSHLSSHNVSNLPIARTHKARITSWMMYWPWSLFWTVMRDLVLDLWKQVYNLLSGLFQKVADKVLGKDLQKDFGA